MDALTIDSLMNEALLAELGDGLDHLADRIAAVHDSWADTGAEPATLAFVASLLSELGWWRGRIDVATEGSSGGF